MNSSYAGYMGKIIFVDLATRQISDYPWSDQERELYLGGKIMAARILYDNLTGKEAPFSDENLLVITTGPLTGTGAPSSSRFNISTISPLTGITTSSNCGGNFGYYLKKAGYDALILKGRAAEHAWLEIQNDRLTFHNADWLWGKKTGETQEALSNKISELRGCPDKSGKICIGPAGENLVKYASIISNERVAGRAGVGAVMGWMNLKAVTASGNHTVPVHNKSKMLRLNQKWFHDLRSHPLTGTQLPRFGTAGLVTAMQMNGQLATRNYKQGQFSDFEQVNGETLAEQFNLVNKGCLNCPIRCARTVTVDGKEVKGPELETLGLLGAGLLNNQLPLVLQWNYELDEWGMDTISAASTLAFAMEANETGLWNNGLRFGETERISQVWEDIACRRGIGSELAEGSRYLSEKYGGKEFAIHSKGLELAAYEPRRAVGQGLGFAVSNRGGCHLNGGYLIFFEGLGLSADSQTPKAKPDLTMLMQDLMETMSAAGQCLFTSYQFFPAFLFQHPNSLLTRAVSAAVPHVGGIVRILNRFPGIASFHMPTFTYTKAISYALGMKMTMGNFIRIGERGYTMERHLNSKFGITAKDDALPARLTSTPQVPGNPKTVVPLDPMKKIYYQARGWNANGIPTSQILKRLKIQPGKDPYEKVQTAKGGD